MVTHVAELIVDLAGLHEHLHVGQADPLVQALAVVDLADVSLDLTTRHDVQHVSWDVILGLGLLIVFFVQAL
jgi:hypothetical protein